MIIFAIAVMLIKLPCQLHCNSKDAINFITPKKLRKNTTRYQFEGSNTKQKRHNAKFAYFAGCKSLLTHKFTL
jgi:hypothetical protein